MSVMPSSSQHYKGPSSQPDFRSSNGANDHQLISETSTPPPPNRVGRGHDLNSEVFTAVYSGVRVFEMTCRGVSVMRRVSDSALNATQILKVAGIEKGRRTKILEREILTGPHEKVQGGYGKYQGTWISYSIGLALCERHSVRDFLSALLDLDPENHAAMNATPTKEQHQASVRKTLTGGRVLPNSGGSSRSSAPVFEPQQMQGRGNSAAILASLQPSRFEPTDRNLPVARSPYDYRAPAPGVTTDKTAIMTNGQTSTNGYQRPDLSNGGSALVVPEVLPPINPKTARDFEHSRELMTSIFLESDSTRVPDVLLNNASEQEVDIDVPIDELGHTALHWASALARLPLVKALISRGADPCRGNGMQETPLIRAVLVTNSMDQNTFIDLLDLLQASIPLRDASKRTVLHHIAITAGIKGRSAASRYYLDSLLEWVVTHGQKTSMNFPVFQRCVVDMQDRNGDSALNIAARIGNISIVQSLLEVSADPYLQNKAGIRPIDSGTVDTRTYQPRENDSQVIPVPIVTPAVIQASGDVISSMTSMIATLQKDFEEEMAAKGLIVENTNSQLRQAGKALADLRRAINDGKVQMAKLDELNQRIENTNRAIQTESREFEQTRLGRDFPDLSANELNMDADEAYRVDANDPSTFENLSASALQARIAAYEKDIDMLDTLAVRLNDQSAAMEARCRKVVSECAGVTVDQVDALLGQLLAAVQSDSSDGGIDYNEASRIAGFLKILTPR